MTSDKAADTKLVRVDTDLWREMRIVAAQTDSDLRSVMGAAIRQYLDRLKEAREARSA